jgi:hypothetical protein
MREPCTTSDLLTSSRQAPPAQVARSRTPVAYGLRRAFVGVYHFAQADKAVASITQRIKHAIEACELALRGYTQIDLKAPKRREPVALIEKVNTMQLKIHEARLHSAPDETLKEGPRCECKRGADEG